MAEHTTMGHEHCFYYDREWLHILKRMAPFFPIAGRSLPPALSSEPEPNTPLPLPSNMDLKVPLNFVISTAIYPFYPKGKPSHLAPHTCMPHYLVFSRQTWPHAILKRSSFVPCSTYQMTLDGNLTWLQLATESAIQKKLTSLKSSYPHSFIRP